MPLGAYEDIVEVANGRVFPLGEIPEEAAALTCCEDGRIVALAPGGLFLVGADINDALNNLTLGIEMPPVYV